MDSLCTTAAETGRILKSFLTNNAIILTIIIPVVSDQIKCREHANKNGQVQMSNYVPNVNTSNGLSQCLNVKDFIKYDVKGLTEDSLG